VWLLPTSGVGLPTWLAAAVGVLGAAAVVELLTSTLRRSDDTHARIAFSVAAAAVLLVPAVGSVQLVAHGHGAYDTPFESKRAAATIEALFVGTPQLIVHQLPELEAASAGSPTLLAVQSTAVGSVFSNVTGRPILSIGGFTATAPVPTIQQLQAAVAQGEVRLALVFPTSTDPRKEWITRHCQPGGSLASLLRVYACSPADAAAKSASG
jgi:hypothetical protein